MSDTLKSCPFCGGEASWPAVNEIECEVCRASIVVDPDIAEIETVLPALWNTRVSGSGGPEGDPEAERLATWMDELADEAYASAKVRREMAVVVGLSRVTQQANERIAAACDLRAGDYRAIAARLRGSRGETT